MIEFRGVSKLYAGDVGLDQAGLNFVVAQAGAGIEGANIVERNLHRFERAADGLGDFLELLERYATQMLIDDGGGVLQHLFGSVAVLMQRQLLLVVAQLVEETSAEIAAGYAGRIQLADDLKGFDQVRGGESWLVHRNVSSRGGIGSRSDSRRGVS